MNNEIIWEAGKQSHWLEFKFIKQDQILKTGTLKIQCIFFQNQYVMQGCRQEFWAGKTTNIPPQHYFSQNQGKTAVLPVLPATAPLVIMTELLEILWILWIESWTKKKHVALCIAQHFHGWLVLKRVCLMSLFFCLRRWSSSGLILTKHTLPVPGRAQLGQMSKTRQKSIQKHVKLTVHTFVCNDLTKFEYVVLAMTGNGSYLYLLKLARNNSWNHFGWTYFRWVLAFKNHCEAPNARTMSAGLAVMAAAPAEKSSEEGFYSDEIMEESPWGKTSSNAIWFLAIAFSHFQIVSKFKIDL